ncbi:amino acid ABC transporter permease [Bradyrhizobium sp. SZCCHNPS2010]|uniref:amino acid ABC transporter permease n=1 Tax=Bradyrhizobium sp. SZCCHNPS2010 TaxID=3057333 RepID=UPI0029164301|nr:amino acid ABC transporter permease [Bradyrhizobium sp. SZCCHNPS2010]
MIAASLSSGDPLAVLVRLTRDAGFNFGFLLDSYERPIWNEGLITTLQLVLCAIVISLVGGALLAAAVTSSRPCLVWPTRAFIELTRNTPTLVQLYCAFMVLNMLVSQALGGVEQNPLTPFFWVVTVAGLHIAAFHAESLRAGLEAVPLATLEAALSLGFSRRQLFWQIQLPLAVRVMLPSITNNLVNLVKLTSIGSAIAVGEIVYASIMIWTAHDNVVELMVLILAVFGSLNLLVSLAGRWLERQLKVPGHGL